MSKRVLVADDERHITYVLDFTFKLAGYDVVIVDDGETALRMARETSPDLVILDVMMPGMDGYEVCRILKADPETRRIPIIMLSAKVQRIDHDLGLEVDADAYVKKPFSGRKLLEVARSLLGDDPAASEWRRAA
jgi:DNA-binding response OmpR family regulator